MDDQPTGRGVYVVRRILAVLVLLLLLILLVPQAYQALLGPREETGSAVQETADVGGSGNDESHEERASNGVTGGIADEVAKQDDGSYNSSNSGETGLSGVAASTSRGPETSEDEYGGKESVESDAGSVGAVDIYGEPAIGEVDHTMTTPVVDAGGQQAFQLESPAESKVPVDLLASVEPTIQDTIRLQVPTYYDYSIYYEDPYAVYYEDPIYYGYAANYEYPAYYDYAAYYEEQVLIESDTSDTYYDTAVVTAIAQADGGAAAYAATGGGVGAYAATSTG